MDICLSPARAERLEAELFAQNMLGRGLGLALIGIATVRAASTPCYAIAAARSPSCGARCAP